MNSKRVNAQMQVNVSFVGNTTKLVKDLQAATKELNFGSSLTKQFETEMNRSFRDVLSNLNKMGEGLGKKGFSAKQYADFFNSINSKIQESTRFMSGMKSALQNIFDSKENKDATKQLEQYRKQLEEINKLASGQKGAQTRRDSAIRKMQEETGIDYELSKRMLSGIQTRKANKQGLTKNQTEWLEANGLDETKLKRVLELLKQINAQSNKITEQNSAAKNITGQSTVGSSQDYLNKQIAKTQGVVVTPEVYKQWMSILVQLDGLIDEVAHSSENLARGFNDELPRATAEAEELAKAQMTVQEILGQFGIVFSAAGVVRQFKELIKYSYEFYKSLDSALNAIYVVSDLSSKSVNNLTSDFIRMAEQTGMAIDDITESAVLYFQQGLSTKEVLEMTEVTAQFAKVAGIDATDAADKLTAAINGYCLAAEDAASVADKFNQVAAASAADINELSTAFSKAAAQANQAGVGMDNYLAYIATMVEATREAPENIGTSLKTIMSRMQQVKEAGTTEDGDTDVNQVETALKSVGVALRDAKGELRDLEEVFAELGPKWQSLDRNTQAYLGTIIAGTRQQSRFITLMQNWDRVLELAEESENSAGMQALMHAKAMESVESKTKELNVAWQEFVSNLTDSSVIKGVITTLTKLLKTVSGGNKPLSLMISSLILMRKQIAPLITGITQWSKKQLENAGVLGKGQKGLTGLITKIKQGVSEYAEIGSQIEANNLTINTLELELQELITKYNELNTATTTTKKAEKENKQAMEDTMNTINQKTAAINNLKTRQDELIKKQQELSSSLDTATNLITGMSMAFTSLSGSSNKVLSFIGTSGTMISQLAVAGFQGIKAVTSLSKAVGMAAGATKSALISTGIGAAIVAIGELINLGMTLYDTFANGNEKLKESVDKVMDSIDEYQTTVTTQKSVNKLVTQYKDLQKQTHLTTEEQEKLNEVTQSLAESLDIEYIEDQYGNLSLDINELNDAINDLDVEKMNAFQEVLKTEQEEGYGLFGKKSGFYDQFFSGNSTSLRKIMTNFSKDLDEELNNLFSEDDFEQFNKDLQTAILDSAKEASDNFSKGFTASGFIAQTSEEINAAISDAEAESMYEFVYSLQESMEGLTYEETMSRISGFVEAWGDAAGLTVQQIEIMKNAIADFAYGNAEENVHNIMKQLDEQIEKYQGFKEVGDWLVEKAGLETDPVEVLKKYLPEDGKNVLQTYLDNQTDENLQAWQEWAKNNKEAHDKAWQEVQYHMAEVQLTQDSLKYTEDDEAGYKIYRDLVDLKEIISSTTNEMNVFLSSVGALEDVDGLKSIDFLKDHLDLGALKQAFARSAEEGASEYLTQLSNAIASNRGTDLEDALQEKFDKAMDGLTVPRDRTWSDLADEISDMSSDLQTLNKVMEEINETGGMSLETFADFCDVLDKLVNSFDDLAAAGQLENVINALSAMELGFNEVTGAIGVNGDAVQSLQVVEEALVKSQLEGIKKQLLAKNAQFDVQITMLEAEWKANDTMIKWLQAKGEADIALTDIETQGAKTYNDAMKVAAADIGSYYQDLSVDSQNYARTSVAAFTAVAEAMGKVITGELTPQAAEGVINTAFANAQATWSSYAGSGLKYAGDGAGNIKASEAAAILQKQNDRISNTINDFKLKKQSLGNMYNLVASMADSGTDLSKLGAKDGDGKEKEIEQYVGKLKEIYNILNRIQNLEHRLSTLDAYSDIAQGEQYGSLLKERLTYNQELLHQYEFLTNEQKQFTNGYKEFIQGQEGLEGVFDFDQFGQIIINWDKYTQLQDTAAEGEVTLKEKADDLYDTYTAMYTDLQGYFDNSIEYYKAVIELQEEMVDNYIDLENKAADTIKEIYQKILDTRLDAIDREKEALEELREAREDARRDQENAKELSGLQTDIQRAMMDTSGASDIALIKAQQDMTSKLEEMAEDKYSRMLDDIIEKLEHEQDELQNHFDDLFSNLEWLFTWLDEDIMGNESALFELLQQSDEWQQTSEIEKRRTLDDWKTKFYSYYEAMTEHENGIFGIYQNITSTRERIAELEKALQTSLSKGSSEIVATLNKWSTSIQNSVKSASSGGGGGGGYTYKDYWSEDTKGGGLNINGNNETGTGKNTPPEDTSYQKWIGKTVEIKGSGNIKVLNSPDEGDSKYVKNPLGTNPNVIVQDVWKSTSGTYWLKTDWKDGVWVKVDNLQTTDFWGGKALSKYAAGGFADFTGPAWLDGTPQKPEAVLNALQTEHFVKFTNALDNMFGNGNVANTSSTVSIDTISFNVESMSSPEDGEAAFNMFVNKFKEIGNRTGIKIDTFKNTL
jgi:TP901 family phage tail tape measure protein